MRRRPAASISPDFLQFRAIAEKVAFQIETNLADSFSERKWSY